MKNPFPVVFVAFALLGLVLGKPKKAAASASAAPTTDVSAALAAERKQLEAQKAYADRMRQDAREAIEAHTAYDAITERLRVINLEIQATENRIEAYLAEVERIRIKAGK